MDETKTLDIKKELLDKITEANTDIDLSDETVQKLKTKTIFDKAKEQSRKVPRKMFTEACEETAEMPVKKITPAMRVLFPGLKKLGIAGLGMLPSLLAEAADSEEIGKDSDMIPGRPETKDISMMNSDELLNERKRRALERLSGDFKDPNLLENMGKSNKESYDSDYVNSQNKLGNEYMMEARRLRSEKAPDDIIRKRLDQAKKKYDKYDELKRLLNE